MPRPTIRAYGTRTPAKGLRPPPRARVAGARPPPPAAGRSGLERERPLGQLRHAELPVVLQRGEHASPDRARSLSRHTLGAPRNPGRSRAGSELVSLPRSRPGTPRRRRRARPAVARWAGPRLTSRSCFFRRRTWMRPRRPSGPCTRSSRPAICSAASPRAWWRVCARSRSAPVWAGALPGAEIDCFPLAAVETDDAIAVAGLPELDEPSLVALLVDPFTFPVGLFLTRLNEAHELIPLAGGVAGGGRSTGRAGAHPRRRGAHEGRGRRRRHHLWAASPHRRLAGLPADRTRGRDHPLRGEPRLRGRRTG